MSKNNENQIVNSCNTCRSPIYLGEPIYVSQDIKSSGQTTGGYGGASYNPERSRATYHGGTYAENTNWTHNQEAWTQCFRCYDEWQAELIVIKENELERNLFIVWYLL